MVKYSIGSRLRLAKGADMKSQTVLTPAPDSARLNSSAARERQVQRGFADGVVQGDGTAN